MRRTKIVATLGPATGSRDRVRELIEAGMDVARINCSHGTHSEHARYIAAVRAEAERSSRAVAILQDLQGPKIRTGPLAGDQPVELVRGRRLVITTVPAPGDAGCVSTTYPDLARDVSPGDRILISDGLLELRVVCTTETDVTTEVIEGGTLRARQGINLPGVRVSTPALTEKDLADLRFGLEHGVDYVALSFVRSAGDIRLLKDAIADAGEHTPVIAKLEKPEALDTLDDILEMADGVMVARGDLGVEMAPEHVPLAQKEIIAAANRAALPVITATQMLQSMIYAPQPTRAEVSDVANAILDGSDAVMLSGETAIGRFPIRSLKMMHRIAVSVDSGEHKRRPERGRRTGTEALEALPRAIGAAASAIVDALPVRAICVLTRTGSSARLGSHFRPSVPILAFTPVESTYRQLSLVWGVMPIRNGFAEDEGAYYRQVQSLLLENGHARIGDTVLVTGGHPIIGGGPTNFVKIMVLEADRDAL